MDTLVLTGMLGLLAGLAIFTLGFWLGVRSNHWRIEAAQKAGHRAGFDDGFAKGRLEGNMRGWSNAASLILKEAQNPRL